MSWRKKIVSARPALVLLAGCALASAGCLAVAAGAAAGGAATYYYVKGRVCQEYAASFPDTWQAVHTALRELGYPVLSQENDAITGKITSRTPDNSAIAIDFATEPSRIPAEGSVTRVCVRVGTFGDQPTSERILAQIGAHLVPAGLVPRQGGPVPTAGPVPPPPSGPITPASWNRPTETAPPPELPDEPVPVRITPRTR